MKKPLFIVIDGLIGAGKTTLIKLLEEKFNNGGIKTVASYEPVDIWESTGALKKFYQDIKGNCYNFQTFTFVTRIQRVLKDVEDNPDAEVFLLERSIFSDKYIFVEMLKNSSMMDSVESAMYEIWWDMWRRIMPANIDLFILLDTSVSDSMKRLLIRNRDGETGGVSQDYQQDLRKTHLDFYQSFLPEAGYKTVTISSDKMSQNYLDDLNHPVLEEIKNMIIKT